MSLTVKNIKLKFHYIKTSMSSRVYISFCTDGTEIFFTKRAYEEQKIRSGYVKISMLSLFVRLQKKTQQAALAAEAEKAAAGTGRKTHDHIRGIHRILHSLPTSLKNGRNTCFFLLKV